MWVGNNCITNPYLNLYFLAQDISLKTTKQMYPSLGEMSLIKGYFTHWEIKNAQSWFFNIGM